MALALFDLDHTLINGDSDFLWNRFLVENELVDVDYYTHENDRFNQQYHQGELDIQEYLAFALNILSQHDVKTLEDWRRQFVEQKIQPLVSGAAKALVSQHQAQGDTTLIITATNYFVTKPIADMFSVDDLIAVKPEILEGRYTGKFVGEPTYRQGKVDNLLAWASRHQQDLTGAYFYSDSHNDLPLLKRVDNPIAINPDDKLRKFAEEKGWPVMEIFQR